MTIEQFLAALQEKPNDIQFPDTMKVIDTYYTFIPTAFQNGSLLNEAGQNNGSCKLLAFAKLQQLDTQQTLHCFGEFYRKDVLEHPNNDDHQNIRNLIKSGLDGVKFPQMPLKLKQTS